MGRFLKEVPGQEGLVSGGFDPTTNAEIRRCVSVPVRGRASRALCLLAGQHAGGLPGS